MPTVPFLIYSTVGTLVWTGALAGLGYALGDQYETVGKWLDPVSKGIVAVLLFGYLWRVVTFKPEQRSEEHTSELQSLMRISYAVFCLKKKKTTTNTHSN